MMISMTTRESVMYVKKLQNSNPDFHIVSQVN